MTEKKVLRVLKLLSLSLAFVLSTTTVISAAEPPELIYNDVEEPTQAHTVKYKGNTVNRPKYYDEQRNEAYASSLTDPDSSFDGEYERKHLSADPETGIIPDEQMQYIDTENVYMDYVHQMVIPSEQDTKAGKTTVNTTVPLTVFGTDMLSYKTSNIYKTYPMQEEDPSDVEEEDEEDTSDDDDDEAETEDETEKELNEAGVERNYASDLEDRHKNVSMNIYPDRITVEDGGDYTTQDAQVLYKVYKTLDNSKVPVVQWDEDEYDIISSDQLTKHHLNPLDSYKVNATQAVPNTVAEDGKLTKTMLGTLETDDGKTTYKPSDYWKISVPVNSINSDDGPLDYAKYINEHYGENLLYGHDYFLYQDPGTFDIQYENALTQYFRDIEDADTVHDSSFLFQEDQKAIAEYLDPAKTEPLSANYYFDTTKVKGKNGVKGEIPFKVTVDFPIPSAVHLCYDFDLNANKPQELTEAQAKDRSYVVNLAKRYAAISENIARYTEEKTDDKEAAYNVQADVLEEVNKVISNYTFDSFVMGSNVIEEITEEEYKSAENANATDGVYFKLRTPNADDQYDTLSTYLDTTLSEINNLKDAFVPLDKLETIYNDFATQILESGTYEEENPKPNFSSSDYSLDNPDGEYYYNSAEPEVLTAETAKKLGVSFNSAADPVNLTRAQAQKLAQLGYQEDLAEWNADYDEYIKGLVSSNDSIKETFNDATVQAAAHITYDRESPTIIKKNNTRYFKIRYQGPFYTFLMNLANRVIAQDSREGRLIADTIPELLVLDPTEGRYKLDTDLVRRGLLYNSQILATDISTWKSSYTDDSKFSTRMYEKPTALARVYLYIRADALAIIKKLADDLYIKSFDKVKVKNWEDGNNYYAVPIGNDSQDFQYTALCTQLITPKEEVKAFGKTFSFNRYKTGINTYYTETEQALETEYDTDIMNITDKPNFTVSAGSYIGVSYYGYFDKYNLDLDLLETLDSEALVKYENPIRSGSAILTRMTWPRQLTNDTVVNPQWHEESYRNTSLKDNAPHIIWYRIEGSGTFNLAFTNYQAVGDPRKLVVTYNDPSKRISNSLTDGTYTRGPDHFLENLKFANAKTYDMESLWPTPEAFGYTFSKEDYVAVESQIDEFTSLGQLLTIGKSHYGNKFDDDSLIELMAQMKKFKINTAAYKEKVTENYQKKENYHHGASGLAGNDYRDMEISQQTLAPYTHEEANTTVTLLPSTDYEVFNPRNDLIYVLDTYGTDTSIKRTIRIRQDAIIDGSSGKTAVEARGQLAVTIPYIYTIYMTDRVDDTLTHEYTNKMIHQGTYDADTLLQYNSSLRTMSIQPGILFIPDVTTSDGVKYDYYELSYSVPDYGTYRASEYLDEDGHLHLISDFQNDNEGYTTLNWDEGSSPTYKVNRRTIANASKQYATTYGLGYACLNPYYLDGEPCTSNKVTINAPANAAELSVNKGTDPQDGDWAFTVCDPYLWTSYMHQQIDDTYVGNSYDNYVNAFTDVERNELPGWEHKTVTSHFVNFPSVGYQNEHVVTYRQHREKHPLIEDDSQFLVKYTYKPSMTIAVTTSEQLDSSLEKDDIFIEFNNNTGEGSDARKRSVEVRYAKFILQSMGKAFMPSENPDWDARPGSASIDYYKLFTEDNYDVRADIQGRLKELTPEDCKAIHELYKKARGTMLNGARAEYYNLNVDENCNFYVDNVNLGQYKRVYTLLIQFAQEYIRAELMFSHDQGNTDRLANNIVFLSNLYPNIIYRVKNLNVSVTAAGDTPFYNSIEAGERQLIYRTEDSKLMKEDQQGIQTAVYQNNLVVWYAKSSPMLPSVVVKTPISKSYIQPTIIKVNESYDADIAQQYAYIVSMRITAPGTYYVKDADIMTGNDLVFTVTSNGIVFNTFYGPFKEDAPEYYLNLDSLDDTDEEVNVRISSDRYTTSMSIAEKIVNGIVIPKERYIYYVLANIPESEVEKISKEIQVTYDNKSTGTIIMDEYKDADAGIYVFYHKVECPGRYFLVDTSKTITVTGAQPTLLYLQNASIYSNRIEYTERNVVSMNAISDDDKVRLHLSGKDAYYYPKKGNSALIAYYEYDPHCAINISYPGFDENVNPMPYTLYTDGKSHPVYGFVLPDPYEVYTSGGNALSKVPFKDGTYTIDKTSVLITSSLETNMYLGYPMLSDSGQLLANDSDYEYSSRMRTMNWFPGLTLYWIGDANDKENYQIECEEYWHADKPIVYTDTTDKIILKVDENGVKEEGYLHRLLIPFPGTFTVRKMYNSVMNDTSIPSSEREGMASKWQVVISPPQNFYIGSTTLKQGDDEITWMARSYNYRPSKDWGNSHIRVLYLACEDYLTPAYYGALMHENDWNLKATWLNQDLGLYKTGYFRDDPALRSAEEIEYLSKDVGEVFYAFDERIIKQHDAELERYEAKLPAFHPLYAEITLPTYDAPYMGGFGQQLLYHNGSDILVDTPGLQMQVGNEWKTWKQLTTDQQAQMRADLKTIYRPIYTTDDMVLITVDEVKGSTIDTRRYKMSKDILYANYNGDKRPSELIVNASTSEKYEDPTVKDFNDAYLTWDGVPYEKRSNGFYFAGNVAAYQGLGYNIDTDTPNAGTASKRMRFGYKTDPAENSRLTMPTNPWAANKRELNPSDGLNGFYYSAYRIKNAQYAQSGTYDGTVNMFYDGTGFSSKDLLGNVFLNSDTYHILSWWSNPYVLNEVSRTNKGVQNFNPDYSLKDITGAQAEHNSGDESLYGRAIPQPDDKTKSNPEYNQPFKKYNGRFWSPFDNASGLHNYDIQGYYVNSTLDVEGNKLGSTAAKYSKVPYRRVPENLHKIICHPIYHYYSSRQTKYQHDMVLPADFSGYLKLPSYITDIDTAFINTYEPHDARTYTGGYYTYTLYVAGQTGLVVQANHTGQFIVNPKKSQHLKVRQTSPWGSYAEYDLNLIFASHLQKDSSVAQLDKNVIDFTMSIEGLPNPYHQDVGVSYKLTDKETVLSAGEYLPIVIEDWEAPAPVYSQILATYMLYQDVPAYRYNDVGHMWMYDWFRRDGYHMNCESTTSRTKDRAPEIDARASDAEVTEGWYKDHILTGSYEKLGDAGVTYWIPATYYDDPKGNEHLFDEDDKLLRYTTDNLEYRQPINDKQKFTAFNGKYEGEDIRSSQNFRTYIRFIKMLDDDSVATTQTLNGLLRKESRSYLGNYMNYPRSDHEPDFQVIDSAPWFFTEKYKIPSIDKEYNQLYQCTDMSPLIETYERHDGTFNQYWNNNGPLKGGDGYVGWSGVLKVDNGLLQYPNRKWEHYYPDIPTVYEVPAGNISNDYINMLQLMKDSTAQPGNMSTWFGKAISDILGRTVFILPRESEDTTKQDTLDLFNYMNARTSIHVRSYQDCINAVVFDSEAYNILQTEIKPIIELDDVQRSDIDGDSNFWIKSLLDNFVNR